MPSNAPRLRKTSSLDCAALLGNGNPHKHMRKCRRGHLEAIACALREAPRPRRHGEMRAVPVKVSASRSPIVAFRNTYADAARAQTLRATVKMKYSWSTLESRNHTTLNRPCRTFLARTSS